MTGYPVTEPALLWYVHIKGSRDSVLRAGRSAVLIPVLDISTRAHTDSRLVGTGGSLPGHEADHLLAHSAEVKNEWNHTSSSPCAFMACCCRRYQVEARILHPGRVGCLCKFHGVEVGFGRVFS